MAEGPSWKNTLDCDRSERALEDTLLAAQTLCYDFFIYNGKVFRTPKKNPTLEDLDTGFTKEDLD